MKKILAVAVALIMVLALVPAFALADTTTVVNDEAGILAALTAGGDIELGADITVDNSSLSAYTKSVTLDLNGYTLYFENSALTFAGAGVNFILKDTDPEGGGLLNFADYYVTIVNHATMTLINGTISAFWYGIAAFTHATVNVEGGAIYTTEAGSGCISGNGSAGSGNTVINIRGGVLEAEYGVTTKDVESMAIYHPQAGTLNISGGKLKGGTGITMVAGTLNMTGGTVSGTANGSPVYENSNGSKGSGSALCLISNDDYAGNIFVNIEGGVLNSRYTYAIDGFSYKNTYNPNETNVTSVKVGKGATLTTPMASAIIAVESDKLTINEAANIQTGVTSLVRANVSPTFTIIIPALVNFGELTNSGNTLVQPFKVALTNALLEPDAQVEVSVVSDFTMDNGGDGTIAYTVTNEAETLAATGNIAETGNIYVIFTGNDIDEGIAACVNTITQAGAYTDTMVFSVFYRP